MDAKSLARARTYTRIQEFLCFCCHKCHSGSRNRLKYSGIWSLLEFVCFWRAEIKKRGWKIDGDVEVGSSRFFQNKSVFLRRCVTLVTAKKLNRCWNARACAKEVPLVQFSVKSIYSDGSRLQNSVRIKFSCQFLADLQLFGCISSHIFYRGYCFSQR